jgi:hypothetical protein
MRELIALEEEFWRASGRRQAYEARLADDAVHVFPGWGVTEDNERVLQAVESAEPWKSFTIENPRVLELGEGVAAIAYTSHACREGEDEYVAAITSVYRRTDEGWHLVMHQQTPL